MIESMGAVLHRFRSLNERFVASTYPHDMRHSYMRF
jgi:hypothetical protein